MNANIDKVKAGGRNTERRGLLDDMPINEPPCPLYKKWYSHKLHRAGLRYEIALSIVDGDIIWANGPYPAGRWSDIKIFRHRLKHFLRNGERVEADRGYRGEPHHISVPDDYENYEQRRVKDRIRSRHETVNKRIKQFGCLSQTYRHSLQKHQLLFKVVLVLTQLSIENGEPLFRI